MSAPPIGTATDALLLAAHPLELAPFAAALGPALAAELHGLRVAAAAVGVGLPAAGGGAARALARYAPRVALLIGSYGVYPNAGEFVPGELLVPARVRAVDAAEVTGRAAYPPAMGAAVEPDAALSQALAACGPARRGAIGTTLGITTDDALASELGARSGCEGENMEALAVGLACRDAAVPFAAVLGCTNRVGARGRAEWLAHRETAAQAVAGRVLAWLEIRAAGR
jgi:nucleoside phosphorylase